MGITKNNSYFEDFNVGDKYIHPRGKTVTEMDNVLFTQIAMNTADAHYNEDVMSKLPTIGSFGAKRVVVGSFTIGLVMGLAAEDCCENALAEVGLDKMRLPNPVFHGDTIYSESEVLGKAEGKDGKSGVVHFRVIGKNQDGKVIFEGERKTLIKKRTAYLEQDEKFGPTA